MLRPDISDSSRDISPRTHDFLRAGAFDSLWEKAIALESHRGGTDSDEDCAQRDDLLRLLAAGLQDESIARALHMSRSTVARRMRELMEELGAKTRFQTGFLAARRLDAVEARRD